MMTRLQDRLETEVEIPFTRFSLAGTLHLPRNAVGLVLFAHGSGSSRHSPRNRFVAHVLHEHGLGTLLFDLLTEREESEDRFAGHLRFNLNFLAARLLGVTDWCRKTEPAMPVAYFGASTGGGAALVAAAQSSTPIAAIVSRGGRPDLAGSALAEVKSPTLLIVGGEDAPVIQMNQDAYARMSCRKEIQIVAGATHLFEEPGTLEQVADMAAEWFEQHFDTAVKTL